MASPIVYDSALTPADHVVLKNLEADIDAATAKQTGSLKVDDSASNSTGAHSRTPSPLNRSNGGPEKPLGGDEEDIAKLKAMRDPAHADYVPSLFLTVDGWPKSLPPVVNKLVLQPYVRWARRVVRHESDVVMLTHLIIYFTTTVPSALLLYRHFSYLHGVLHLILQGYYMGTYTLMMHQHIHQRGILAKEFSMFDQLFPYVTDPLMGHTWNGYYYHHVKHHHVEGNGPGDLSSTIRFQRDNLTDFLQYVGRFYFFIWFDLPRYFIRKNRLGMAAQAAASELLTYAFYYTMLRISVRPTIFVYLLPLMFMRLGLMVGNWGQHALVDEVEPDSDFRSSITLIDVASNRFCFNDGYHTSHHLNPLRHWRDHPMSFLEQKQIYAKEGALVFHNIDYIMVTIRLLRKDYETLAKCLVPIGGQIDLTMEQKVNMLKRLTRKFSEEEIRQKFRAKA